MFLRACFLFTLALCSRTEAFTLSKSNPVELPPQGIDKVGTDYYCDHAHWNLVESIPVGVDLYAPIRTHKAWVDIINRAENYVHIAALYLTLTGGEDYGRTEGDQVIQALFDAIDRGIEVKIALSGNFDEGPSDAPLLEKYGAIVQYVNVTQLMGSGVLHTKMIIVDGHHYYIGSANMDWRSLSEVKEMGVVVTNCSLLTHDLDKIFDTYWILSESDTIPDYPVYVETQYNDTNPFVVPIDSQSSSVYFGSSPVQANPRGRTWDLNSFKWLLATAKTVSGEVMDYEPMIVFDASGPRYWSELDSAFREAATIHNTTIRLLISKWENTDPGMRQFLDSLNAINNIEVRFSLFPHAKPSIPYTRVNHAKYLVTDQKTLITTSNWEGDYFTTTLGVSQVSNSTFLRKELQSRFDRDWDSQYAHPMEDWDKYNQSSTTADAVTTLSKIANKNKETRVMQLFA